MDDFALTPAERALFRALHPKDRAALPALEATLAAKMARRDDGSEP